jgi:hypothetical protein
MKGTKERKKYFVHRHEKVLSATMKLSDATETCAKNIYRSVLQEHKIKN